MGHKVKSRVTKEEFSQNNYNQPSLKRELRDISFKGGFSFVKKVIESSIYKKTKIYDYNSSVDTMKRYFQSSVESLTNAIKKQKTINKQIILDESGKIQFKEKKFLKQVTDGIIYPLKLPLHLLDTFINVLRKRQIVSENFGKNSNTLFGKFRNRLDDSDKFNSLVGFVKSADKYKYDSEKVRAAALFRDGMKAFDPKSGNYNSVHERALTRIVTGFIPAFFLANDAYNLSRLCDDDPKLADKEKKIRFNQESKRVLSNAYIQLITLGALSKFVNSSKLAFVTVTVITTLFTEIYSRLSNGKKIHFISKEEAQKINKKEQEKIKNNKKEDSTVSEVKDEPAEKTSIQDEQITPEKTSNRPGFKSSMVFKDFAIPSNISFTDRTKEVNNNKNEKEQTKELKPLLNVKSIVTWILGTIAIGYAIKAGKYGYKKLLDSKKLADKPFIKTLKNIKANNKERTKSIEKFFGLEKIKGKTLFEKLYNKITTKEHRISQEEFKTTVERLRTYDSGLGSKFHLVTKNYQKYEKIKEFASEFAQELRKAGLEKYADEFENIAKGEFTKARKNKIIKSNFENFYNQLIEQKELSLADEIKNKVINADGSINTDSYE